MAGAARGAAATADGHQRAPASADHQHVQEQELHVGELPRSLLHPGGRRERPAQGRAGRVHQPSCVLRWVLSPSPLLSLSVDTQLYVQVCMQVYVYEYTYLLSYHPLGLKKYIF